jgi:hypothetical protein
MKLEANIEAVILRQSLQLQTKVSTRPGEVVGCWFGALVWAFLSFFLWLGWWWIEGHATYEEALDGAAEAGGCGGLAVFAAFDAFGREGESSGAHVEWLVGCRVG